MPDVDGPAHPYMLASPGCWRVYGEVSTRIYQEQGLAAVHGYHVDCYAAQHSSGAEHDRRQRQSVAVHLTTLCLLLERGMPAEKLLALRGRMSQTVLPRLGRSDWPHLIAPGLLGTVTVVDVAHASNRTGYAAQMRDWAEAVWTAWTDHHEQVRQWASAALGRPV